jgi:large subunit ribosomal protein L25
MAFSLNTTKRELEGTSASRRLRHTGSVPATIYGNKTEPISITLTQRDALLMLESGQRLVDVQVGKDKKIATIIKDVQYHPVKDLPIHIDFQNVEDNAEFTTRVVVKILNKANAVGIKTGGSFQNYLHFLKIKATAKTLPTTIDVDIINLVAAKSFLVRDLPEAKYTVINPANEAICKITKAKAE